MRKCAYILSAYHSHLEVVGGSEGLAAESRGSLLAPAPPGPKGTVDVVEAGDAHLDSKVLAIGQGHFFAVKLLEAVHVLWPGRPGVGLDEAGVAGVLLRRRATIAKAERVVEYCL